MKNLATIAILVVLCTSCGPKRPMAMAGAYCFRLNSVSMRLAEVGVPPITIAANSPALLSYWLDRLESNNAVGPV